MTQIICTICNFAAKHFEPVGIKQKRQNAKCPCCGSYERHRLIWWYLCEKKLIKNGMHLLDIAPMLTLARAIQTGFHINYLSIDLGGQSADMRMDLEKLAFKDESFDAVLCMHVLEHVRNDHQALCELARILLPGGWAVLMAPINELLLHTDEDLDLVDPQARERRFGQSDHLRQYGRDYLQRCEAAGFRMEVITPDDRVVRRYALLPNEKIYLGWRK